MDRRDTAVGTHVACKPRGLMVSARGTFEASAEGLAPSSTPLSFRTSSTRRIERPRWEPALAAVARVARSARGGRSQHLVLQAPVLDRCGKHDPLPIVDPGVAFGQLDTPSQDTEPQRGITSDMLTSACGMRRPMRRSMKRTQRMAGPRMQTSGFAAQRCTPCDPVRQKRTSRAHPSG